MFQKVFVKCADTQQTGILQPLNDVRATVSIINPQTLLRLTSTAIFNSIRGISINLHRWKLMNSDAFLVMQRACVSMAMAHWSSTWVHYAKNYSIQCIFVDEIPLPIHLGQCYD